MAHLTRCENTLPFMADRLIVTFIMENNHTGCYSPEIFLCMALRYMTDDFLQREFGFVNLMI